jgi:hypothetical protein
LRPRPALAPGSPGPFALLPRDPAATPCQPSMCRLRLASRLAGRPASVRFRTSRLRPPLQDPALLRSSPLCSGATCCCSRRPVALLAPEAARSSRCTEPYSCLRRHSCLG